MNTFLYNYKCINSTFEEIMQNLSTSLYKACNKKTTPRTKKPRFSSYKFCRSAVPEFLPDERYYI